MITPYIMRGNRGYYTFRTTLKPRVAGQSDEYMAFPDDVNCPVPLPIGEGPTPLLAIADLCGKVCDPAYRKVEDLNLAEGVA